LIELSFREVKEIYAIVETGGKQYRVTTGQVVDVDHLNLVEGETVELDKVLLVADGDKVAVGNPVIEGARVLATCQGDGKTDKTIVFRYRNKVRYRKKTGHRQLYSRLVIDKIIGPEGMTTEPVKKVSRQRKKKEVKESGA
jgi:large subunit ribosomal protein L21